MTCSTVRRRDEGGWMDTALILLQGAVVILAILLGVRMGESGSVCGAWSGWRSWCSSSGCILASRAARRCSSSDGDHGGVDDAVRRWNRPPGGGGEEASAEAAHIAVIAPIVAFVSRWVRDGVHLLLVDPGDLRRGVRQQGASGAPVGLAGTESQFAITASPVSAAMATLVGLVDPVGSGSVTS